MMCLDLLQNLVEYLEHPFKLQTHKWHISSKNNFRKALLQAANEISPSMTQYLSNSKRRCLTCIHYIKFKMKLQI